MLIKRFVIPLAASIGLLSLLTACAATRTSMAPGVDLGGYDRLYLVPPPEDFPGLQAMIAAELRRTGWAVRAGRPAAGRDSTALLAGYTFVPRRTLNEEGEALVLLESLAMYIRDAQSGRILARATYSYNWRDEPAAAMVAAVLAALPRPAGADDRRSVITEKQQAPVAAMKESAAPPAVAARPPAESAPAALPAGLEPEPVQSETWPTPAPSGWPPRIKSWGFENWGHGDIDE